MSQYKKITFIAGLCAVFAVAVFFHIQQVEAANPYFTTTQSMFPFVNGQSTIGTTSPETFGERRYKTLFVQDIDMTGTLTSTSTATTTYVGGIKARGFDGIWATLRQLFLGDGSATTTVTSAGGDLTITGNTNFTGTGTTTFSGNTKTLGNAEIVGNLFAPVNTIAGVMNMTSFNAASTSLTEIGRASCR